MKRLKVDKVKRGRIILSAILTSVIALLSLGFGAYFGYVTLNINYITLGTMTPAIGGLLVIAGFFIFFGCLGGVIAVKEIFISSRNEEKFSAYKGALISAMIFYVVIAIICIVGIILSLTSYLPSNFTWTIFALAIFTLLLCGGAFYCVMREMKEHKKKNKNKKKTEQVSSQDNGIANMNLPASEIHKLKDTTVKPENQNFNQFVGTNYETYGKSPQETYINSQPHYNPNIQNVQNNSYHNQQMNMRPNYQAYQQNQRTQMGKGSQAFMQNYQNEQINEQRVKEIQEIAKEMDFVSLAEKLMQLEELRKAGLINDQEYQELKRKCIV